MKVYKAEGGITKISIGNVISTDTISLGSLEKVTTYQLKGVVQVAENGEGIGWQFTLEPEDVVYGLGENVRGMNKRGFVYESFCSDDPVHTPDKSSLYAAHNFLVVKGEETYGVYVDAPGKVVFDVGFEDENLLTLKLEDSNFDLYIFEGAFHTIVKNFRKAIGLSYVPPKWGFGYQQSRWSYEDKNVVKEIADAMDEHKIPCDAIYLDIDYMESFKDFTIDHEKFSDFQEFVSEMSERDLKLVPIIDAGVKIEDGYDVYDEGIKDNYFCTDEEGKPFVAAVWPGKVHFPDFLNSEVRHWFGEKYHKLLALGIKGFWNDMNEPAIFYSEKGLKDAIDFVKSQENTNLDIYSFFELKDQIYQLSNSDNDYKSMYHNMDGKLVNHYDVHNLYGYKMTQSANDGFELFDSRQRFLMITRASHIGMAKYSGIWTGDNCSWWEHLKLNIQMMPGLNMAGFLYSGADTGGFGSNCSSELLIRWMQFSIFTPLLRNHSAMGTRRQEPWAFGKPTLKTLKRTIEWRYAFIAYLYSEFMKANFKHDLIFAPLSYRYEGKRVAQVEDQLLLGESLMLTPIYEQNAKGRYVHLPEEMVLWKLSQETDVEKYSFSVYPSGNHYIDISLDEIPLWLLPNKLHVITKPATRVSKLDERNLMVIGYVNDFARYTLFNDDGISKNHEQAGQRETTFEVKKMENRYDVLVDTNDADLESVTFYLIDSLGECHVVNQKTCAPSTHLI